MHPPRAPTHPMCVSIDCRFGLYSCAALLLLAAGCGGDLPSAGGRPTSNSNTGGGTEAGDAVGAVDTADRSDATPSPPDAPAGNGGDASDVEPADAPSPGSDATPELDGTGADANLDADADARDASGDTRGPSPRDVHSSDAQKGDGDGGTTDVDTPDGTGDTWNVGGPCRPNGSTRACGTDQGACRAGTQTCTNGTWGSCRGRLGPAPETCDTKDNDCDGQIDEQLERQCSKTKGVCAGTVKRCTSGSWQTCADLYRMKQNYAADETSCDGVDNDCDGRLDEGCTCTNGDTRPCGQSEGQCTEGTQTCKNGSWGTCKGQTAPSNETCDGEDDDCDGTVDENTGGQQTTCGTGACSSTGTEVCRNGQLVDNCSSGTPSDEVCDGVDNDCDGQIDEEMTRSCGTSTGQCQTGTQTCNNGQWGSCQGEVTPSPETCNGEDDNCNGTIDENTGGRRTNCGTGACSSTGREVCRNGRLVDTCNPGSSSNEVCDGIDNDCDGQTDENLTQSCGTSTGQCETGTETCNNGRWGTCRGSVSSSSETCDGKDNDCDGQVDEGIACPYTKQFNDGGGREVAVDGAGNVYFCGETRSGVAGQPAGDGSDLFVVKYDDGGTRQWAHVFQQPGNQFAGGCDVDKGNVAVTTRTSSSMFLAVLDAQNGGLQWNEFKSSAYMSADVEIGDNTGDVFVAGAVETSWRGQPYRGSGDVFVARYGVGAGRLKWVRTLGSSANEEAVEIAVDGNEAFVTGFTDGGIGNQSAQGRSDAFVASYDTDGTREWATLVGGAGYDVGDAIETAPSGPPLNGYVYVGLTGTVRGKSGPVVVRMTRSNIDWVSSTSNKLSSIRGLHWRRQDSRLYVTGRPSSGNTKVLHYDDRGNQKGWTATGAIDRVRGLSVTTDYIYLAGDRPAALHRATK